MASTLTRTTAQRAVTAPSVAAARTDYRDLLVAAASTAAMLLGLKLAAILWLVGHWGVALLSVAWTARGRGENPFH